MLHEFGGEVDRANVVVVDEAGALEGAVALVEKLTQLGGLCHAVGYNAVLGLRAGAGDDNLPLGGPGDKVGAQEHGITRSGSVCVRIASPVSVGVDHELRCRGGSK
jgi:hypothetical protein